MNNSTILASAILQTLAHFQSGRHLLGVRSTVLSAVHANTLGEDARKQQELNEGQQGVMMH